MRRTLSILIENKPGALARVVGLFHQRGYNIESLNVAPIFDGSYSRMTVSTRGTENVVEQITKQINKLIDVIKVSDLTEGEHHEIEMILTNYSLNKRDLWAVSLAAGRFSSINLMKKYLPVLSLDLSINFLR